MFTVRETSTRTFCFFCWGAGHFVFPRVLGHCLVSLQKRFFFKSWVLAYSSLLEKKKKLPNPKKKKTIPLFDVNRRVKGKGGGVLYVHSETHTHTHTSIFVRVLGVRFFSPSTLGIFSEAARCRRLPSFNYVHCYGR